MEAIGYFLLSGLLGTVAIAALLLLQWRWRSRRTAWVAGAVLFLQLNVVVAQYAFLGSDSLAAAAFVLSAAMVAKIVALASLRSGSRPSPG